MQKALNCGYRTGGYNYHIITATTGGLWIQLSVTQYPAVPLSEGNVPCFRQCPMSGPVNLEVRQQVADPGEESVDRENGCVHDRVDGLPSQVPMSQRWNLCLLYRLMTGMLIQGRGQVTGRPPMLPRFLCP